MPQKPKCIITPGIADYILEGLSIVLILVQWILILVSYTKLPINIPIHFNALGKADGFGSRILILSLPVLSTLLCIGLSILNLYPHHFNYLIEITPKNIYSQYKLATRFIRYLKLAVVVLFGTIEFCIIQNPVRSEIAFGNWFLPLFLGLLFLPIFYYLYSSAKQQ